MALRYFRQTAAIDLADTHVAIDGGVHIAALGPFERSRWSASSSVLKIAKWY